MLTRTRIRIQQHKTSNFVYISPNRAKMLRVRLCYLRLLHSTAIDSHRNENSPKKCSLLWPWPYSPYSGNGYPSKTDWKRERLNGPKNTLFMPPRDISLSSTATPRFYSGKWLDDPDLWSGEAVERNAVASLSYYHGIFLERLKKIF
jgi:hypothetical protein